MIPPNAGRRDLLKRGLYSLSWKKETNHQTFFFPDKKIISFLIIFSCSSGWQFFRNPIDGRQVIQNLCLPEKMRIDTKICAGGA
jgi:hypothetical protein